MKDIIDIPVVSCPSPDEFNIPYLEREYRIYHATNVVMDDLDNYIGIGKVGEDCIVLEKQFTWNQRKMLNEMRDKLPEIDKDLIAEVLKNNEPNTFPFGL